MLNYVKAELWKVSRRRSFWALAGILAALAFLFFLLYTLSGATLAELAGDLPAFQFVGMLLAPLLVQAVDGRCTDTLKNEVSFGLERRRIYLGKLWAVLLAGVGLALALMGGALGLGWLFLSHGTEDNLWLNGMILLFVILAALPLWCGSAAFCHMAAMLIPSAGAWVGGYYLLFFFGQPILVVIASLFFGGNVNVWPMEIIQTILMPYSLLMAEYLSGSLSLAYQLWCWGVGMLWLLGSTAAGLLLFARRDVR
ncbi:ABC transporter permease [Pseudoflavonifractor phocaeensis]|uniref:ABC transporter permease n=1 Tax=Pseudoflavonifractor phocaeensis TaxID=1870988 RepID=UPI00195F084A|nr:ABC transporter permease [Pseudoflavonifractor phocaeensis]MBM6869246.1 ABC transporter permease [Pseudoflavonifractor phocaeensis]MBM6936994.1 ABC transporter permease [Pseudoflavonifractor phocaeensis]